MLFSKPTPTPSSVSFFNNMLPLFAGFLTRARSPNATEAEVRPLTMGPGMLVKITSNLIVGHIFFNVKEIADGHTEFERPFK